MVDATPAESAAAREFSEAVDALLAGDQARREDVRRKLAGWRDQYEALKPVFAASSLAAELEPLSRDVAAVAVAGSLRWMGPRRGLGRAAGWREEAASGAAHRDPRAGAEAAAGGAGWAAIRAQLRILAGMNADGRG